jgi:hypothetical protein
MRQLARLVLWLTIATACGCNGAKPKAEGLESIAHRTLPENVRTIRLTPATLDEVYGVKAFVYARHGGPGGKATLEDDTSAAPGLPLDDARLVIFAEGSGDSLAGFRHTAKLIAESPESWPPGASPSLLLLPVHWSMTSDVVLEHVSLNDQSHGAVQFQDLVHVHSLRHERNHQASVSVLAFSAGTRVVQLAFGARIDTERGVTEAGPYPDYMGWVDNVVFVGSSLARTDLVPLEIIRGRLVNFVNPRDTHFGDRAPSVAPAGGKPRLDEVVNPLRIVYRSPGLGASAVGFDELPTLTAPGQFTAADATPEGRAAFRRVNVRVPTDLVPYNLLGVKVVNDDLDDFLNLARNHYIMVGRGAGGTTGGPEFEQYRQVAAAFVQKFVAPVLATGRLTTTVLGVEAKPLTPLDVLAAPVKGLTGSSGQASEEQPKPQPSP